MSTDQRIASSPTLDRIDRILIAVSAGLTVVAGICHYVEVNAVLAFGVSGAAVGALAALAGRAVDQLSERMSPGTTGVVQSALGNLPELFIALFALRAGLTDVATSAVVGSILANILLVLGLAFTVGGLKHGTQHFSAPLGATDGHVDAGLGRGDAAAEQPARRRRGVHTGLRAAADRCGVRRDAGGDRDHPRRRVDLALGGGPDRAVRRDRVVVLVGVTGG